MHHIASWHILTWHLIAYICHTWAEWTRKTDSFGRMGVPNPFSMRSRSPYPFSGPQWPCVASLRDRFSMFSNCIVCSHVFSNLVFLIFPALNRLGGNSISLFLSFPFAFTYRCFPQVESSSDALLRCDQLPSGPRPGLWTHGHRKLATPLGRLVSGF